jgi:hypothetical protein
MLLACYAWVAPIRKAASIDIPLDRTATELRVAVVLLALAASPVTKPFSEHPVALALRITAGLFFVWPNCAYYLTSALRWLRLLPGPSADYRERLRAWRGEDVPSPPEGRWP